MRILLVEDYRDIAAAHAIVLRNGGHDVTIVESIGGAAAAMDSNDFDLLLSDLQLPDGTGWDLVQSIGATHRRPIPAIALSAHGFAQDVERSRHAGFAMHLTKPVDIPLLLSMVDRVASAQHA